MTHPLFRQEIYLETAFERRFQAMLRFAWQRRSWHVIVADPGSGKTMGIRELVRMVGSPALLAVTAPKNNEDEQAIGNQLFAALGVPLRGRWSDRKPKLMGYLHQYGTECLIVDDAHDLSLEHLMFLKELTDQGVLQYAHPLGLCLVAAGRGNTIPLKETLDQPDTMWLQFRRRLDKLEPFCRVAGHTSEEVREILGALETIYQELFPQLNLRQWTGSIYTWLTHPLLDPTNSGRVTMDYLMKLVTTALEWSHANGETDVRAETLQKAASLLMLRRDTLRIIDGAGPNLAALTTRQAEEQQSDSPRDPVPRESRVFGDTERTGGGEQTFRQEHLHDQKIPPQSTKCAFSGVIPIDSQRFLDSGVRSVECPDCTSIRTLSLNKGALRFPSHDRRKTGTSSTDQRWARRQSDWEVVGRK